MDRTKRDLKVVVASQKDQLARYEKRLKDVVTAYKGLLKEKEALETSLAAITSNNGDGVEDHGHANLNKTTAAAATEQISPPTDSASTSGDDKNQLRTQIITLMNSLATLSAEKSRMEASFQADKKQLRAQLAQKDEAMAKLQQQLKDADKRAKLSIEEIKAKWLVERQEREQETNNQMLMIRELQKLYGDERHLKENIEMQLNNFKMQFASDEAENTRLRELQLQLKEARAQLKHMQQSSGSGDQSGGVERGTDTALFKQMQREMHQLKEQHAAAIKNEQRRVLRAEEQSKQLASVHEERVANLEARLAELSATVGSYDRLRQQDQCNIQQLKQKLHEIERIKEQTVAADKVNENAQNFLPRSSAGHSDNVAVIIGEIERLKAVLLSKNASATNPIDLSKIFPTAATDHQGCQEELRHLHQQHEAAKNEVLQLHEKLQVQRTHIATLQEKVKVLNRNIDEQEQELKHRSERQYQAVLDERAKWKVTLSEIESDCRAKLYEMEQQLQKQRQRSLQLLEEKEQEIKTLHTSFEVFHTTANNNGGMTVPNAALTSDVAANHYAASSDGESVDSGGGGLLAAAAFSQTKTITSTIKSKKLSMGDSCHMLHYANELARKDIEIAGLRKAKYAAETSLRKAIHEKVSVQQEFSDTIEELEQQVDRLERCKTREGANLEYLKNVVISFIVTKDAEDKQHMLNAISAVLQFTSSEIQTTNAAFLKK